MSLSPLPEPFPGEAACGYSVRRIGAESIVRQWSQPAMAVRVAEPVGRVLSLPAGREQTLRRDKDAIVLEMQQGDYLVQ